jgi:predicted Zn-ribbon and HTH transcriptional regulator
MPLTSYTCKKCGYTWIPRTERKPKECPECKRRKWDEEPKRKEETKTT